MPFRYYHADRIREKMPEYKGTDEELQEIIDDISLQYNSAIREVETKLQILSDPVLAVLALLSYLSVYGAFVIRYSHDP
jgi:hypothetical protein